MKTFGVFIAALIAASFAHAGGPEFKEGAICDRQAGFCADHMGVSVGLTKEYLGESAEKKLMERIRKLGEGNFDPTWFTMSGGLTRKTEEKTCWTSRYGDKVDKKATATLFGKQAR
jgi:hypothetical protein